VKKGDLQIELVMEDFWFLKVVQLFEIALLQFKLHYGDELANLSKGPDLSGPQGCSDLRHELVD